MNFMKLRIEIIFENNIFNKQLNKTFQIYC